MPIIRPKKVAHFAPCVMIYPKHLPRIIQHLSSAKIGFAGDDNFATIELFDEHKANILYKVAFVVYRFEKKLRLHISNAYPIEQWKKLKPVGSFKITDNLLKGKLLPKLQK